jgi:GxxExxY protein
LLPEDGDEDAEVEEDAKRRGAERRGAERRGAERRGAERRGPMTIDELSYQIIGAAMVVHTDVGPGLNEKTYDSCFGDQLFVQGLQFEHQVRFPVVRFGRQLPSTFRVDYIVRKVVIVEIKAVQNIHPVHVAQLRSYLKMSGLSLGLIINFNVVHLRDGIKRVVNGYVSNVEV